MFDALRKKVSKRNLRSGSGNTDESEHPSLRPPPLNGASLVSFLPIPSPPQTPRFKRQKKKPSQPDEAPPLPTTEPPDPGEQEIKLDTNFDEMDGIIDIKILSNGGNDASSPSSGFASSMSHSHSDSSQFGSPLKFNNPFAPEAQLQSGFYPPRKSSRKVSPNTIEPPPEPPTAPTVVGPVHTESWTAPESWSVAFKDGNDPGGAADSDSDESVGGTRHRASVVPAPGHHAHGSHGRALAPRANGMTPAQLSAKEDVVALAKRAGAKRAVPQHKIRIRIYKADNTYHVVSVPTNVTVAALTPKLDQKLPVGEEREMHQLYLKERGRGEFPLWVCATASF
jgi:adenylate cyclase